ncbi:hypothetical protein [Methanococcoides burtonii]|uniref:hypothetical protein n=1 Tax=Methanococcoides burtonii TaxID=29291 RepID=UPI0018DD2970|nr:hypothetical protein [Methanococcoides burtonii]
MYIYNQIPLFISGSYPSVGDENAEMPVFLVFLAFSALVIMFSGDYESGYLIKWGGTI